MFQWFSQRWYSRRSGDLGIELEGDAIPLFRCRGLSSNVLSLTDAVETVDGLQREARPGADPRRRLRAGEAGRRGRPRAHPGRPDARPRGSRESSTGLPRRVLSGREQRDRDEQGPPPSNSGDEPAALQALRVLRPLARVPALDRLRGRAGVSRAGAPGPRDVVRSRPSRHADLRRYRTVLPEPCLPGRRVAAVPAGPRVRPRLRPGLGVLYQMSRFAGRAE